MIKCHQQLIFNLVVRDILYIDFSGSQVNGTVNDNGIMTVNPTTISIDMGFGPMDIDVIWKWSYLF